MLREPLLSAWRPIESFRNCELVCACATMDCTGTRGAMRMTASASTDAVMIAGAAPRRRAILKIAPSTVVMISTSAPPLEPVRAMAVMISAQQAQRSARRRGNRADRSTRSEQMK